MASDDSRALRAQLAASPFSEDLQEARSAYEQMGLMYPVGDGVTIRAERLGGCPSEIVVPDLVDSPPHAVLYLHGGGYALGSCNTHRHVTAELCRQTGAQICPLEYRLAPEHPLPAALDDALAAYRELLQRFSPSRVALAGDSAGGGLAVALLSRLRGLGLAMPAAAYCMSPWVDLRCNAESLTAKAAEDPMVSPRLLELMASRYLAGASADDPRATPLLADLTGLPPMLLQVGSAEVLLDDAVGLARALGMSGVQVSLEIWAEMVHVWPCFYPALPEGREALGRGCRFLSTHLANP